MQTAATSPKGETKAKYKYLTVLLILPNVKFAILPHPSACRHLPSPYGKQAAQANRIEMGEPNGLMGITGILKNVIHILPQQLNCQC